MIGIKSLGVQVLWMMVLLIFMTSCEKEKEGKDFIEFVLDGEHVHIEKFETTQGNINAHHVYIGNVNLFSFGYTGTHSGKPSGGSFGFSDPNEFALKNYEFDGTAPGGLVNFPTFIFVISPDATYTLTPQGGGNITLTFYEGSNSGDVFEGTFNFTGVEKKNEAGEVVLSNLAVSNGRFKVTLE